MSTANRKVSKVIALLLTALYILAASAGLFAVNASAENVAQTLFADNYYATWKEYKEAANLETVTWNAVVDAMDEVIRVGKEKYAGGDSKGAYDCINNGYYGYYETTGFERVAMGYISGARKSEMELQFSACKSVTKNGGSTDEFNAQCDKLSAMLREDANILDGTPSDSGSDSSEDSGGSSSDAVAVGGGGGGIGTFIACFGIILREGLEAILVVGAIIAYLVKSGNKNKLGVVYAGCILAIIASFVCAWLLDLLKLANSANQEVIEGITALIAVVVLFWVSNWMVSKAESDAWNKYIDDQVKVSAETGNVFTLGFTAFLAVFREGAEVILFYQPLMNEESMGMMWSGFGVGCVVLVFVFLAIRFLSVKLPIRPFFLGTSILMFVMSISFLGSGIKELIEGDVITMTSPDWLASLIPTNDVFDVLGIYPCLETLIPQLILIVVTFLIFVIQKWPRNNKTEAGIIAILFGGIGMHKFYIGRYGQGILYLIFCWSLVPAFLGIAEGVHYLTETDEEFREELDPKAKKKKKAAKKTQPAAVTAGAAASVETETAAVKSGPANGGTKNTSKPKKK